MDLQAVNDREMFKRRVRMILMRLKWDYVIAGQMLKAHPSTVRRWEQGLSLGRTKHREQVTKIIAILDGDAKEKA